MSIKSVADIYMTYRFIRALVTPFEKTNAFKLGIIDEDGKPLKKKRDLKTTREKNAYTIYERLVFKLKRLLEKIPGGKTRLASFAAALWLIKESNIVDSGYVLEEEFEKHLDKLGLAPDIHSLYESYETTPSEISSGEYVLTNPYVAEVFDGVKTGSIVYISEENTTPCDSIIGVSLFRAYHKDTNTEIVVSHEEIQPIYR